MGPGRGQSRALIDPPGLPFGRAIGVPFGYFQGPAMGLSRGQNSALIDLSESPFHKLSQVWPWVSYISWYVLGGMSLIYLPMFA